MKHFDCVVVGGGMVGAASALTLAQLGLRVALIEQFEPEPYSAEQSIDLRVSAISLASQHLLEQLGAWSQVIEWRACPYKRLGVWEQEYAYAEFNTQDIKQQQLGHIVENRLLQLALWQEIKAQTNIVLFCPYNLTHLSQNGSKVSLTLKNNALLTETNISAKLVIAADGANSQVRKMVDIGITAWDYQQSAMLINVKTEKPQQDITWQQFFPTGPVAFLPLKKTPLTKGDLPQENNTTNAELGGYASLVWYHQRDEIKRLSALSNQQLQQEIITAFPKRLGKIEVVDKGAFPLTRRHANSYQSKRVLLLGDAAHTINPMAGQGVNLGFKDVKALQTVIASAIANGESWHDINVLARYETMRRKDNLLMMSTMDALYHSFSHPSSMVKMVRNMSLFAINKMPFIKTTVKNKALAYACGV
ncbi:MAG: FAD-dependent monooxygenase [Colwellia sp.]|nr:FAD-dependent monooxygenase [Colwellia sp.]